MELGLPKESNGNIVGFFRRLLCCRSQHVSAGWLVFVWFCLPALAERREGSERVVGKEQNGDCFDVVYNIVDVGGDLGHCEGESFDGTEGRDVGLDFAVCRFLTALDLDELVVESLNLSHDPHLSLGKVAVVSTSTRQSTERRL